MTGVLTYILTFDALPELDRIGRPKMFYGQRIHDKCYRRAFFDAGQFVEAWDDDGARKGWCLYKMGCRGPTTYNSCSTVKWNNGVSFPIGSGHGCIGCSEENFWDNGPFYERLSNIPVPGIDSTPDTIGKTSVPPLHRRWRPPRIYRRPPECPQGARTKLRPPARKGIKVIMTTRVVVDPVTRIEGHLRVEAMLDDGGHVHDAMSSGTMWRGIEVILQGRDPRDAWAFCERICGVCTTVHALASVRCVENALGIQVPKNADIIRNIMFLTQMVQDHVIHFYHLHALDWVDVVSALKADPAATAALAQKVSPHWPLVDRRVFPRHRRDAEEVRGFRPARHFPERLLGPSGLQAAAGSQPDGGGALSGSAEVAKGDHQDPHHLRRQESASELPGGRHGVGHLHAERQRHQHGAAQPGERPDRRRPSTLWRTCISRTCWRWPPSIRNGPRIGGGLGNYMVYGDLPQNGIGDVSKFRFPRGVILNKNLAEVLPVDLADPGQIQEEICALLVSVSRRQDVAASLGGRHRGEVHRPEAALQATR